MPVKKNSGTPLQPSFSADYARSIATKFTANLVRWQQQYGRNGLPWQQTQDPYRVWLSEIMLQQTQVATVLNYYPRFLAAFPSVSALAAAQQEDVLALWSGLGYYSRARNLHRCAQMVVQEHGGIFPQTLEGLMRLPGIGRSTAAAIAAFCYGARISILDGNVKRVLSRVLAYGGDISTSAADKELWSIAQLLVPKPALVRQYLGEPVSAMSRYTQGLMDLGATICLPRKTLCEQCPQVSVCEAKKQGTQLSYPVKTRKLKHRVQHGFLLWITSSLGVWLVQRPAKGIWGGLYSMPVFEDIAQQQTYIEALKPSQVLPLPVFKHVLTHIDWLLQPVQLELTPQQASQMLAELQALGGQWFSADEWPALGLPAPVRKLLELGRVNAPRF